MALAPDPDLEGFARFRQQRKQAAAPAASTPVDPDIEGFAQFRAKRQTPTNFVEGRTRLGSGARSLARETVGGTGDVVAGLPDLTRAFTSGPRLLARTVGLGDEFDSAIKRSAEPYQKVGRALRRKATETLPEDQYSGEFFAGTVPKALGSMIPGVAAAAVNPGLGVSAFMAQGAEATGREAEQSGATQEQIETARRGGAVIGAAEMIPVGRLLSRYVGPLGEKLVSRGAGALRRTATAAGGQAAEEATQEAGSQVAQNVLARDIAGYDPNRGYTEGVAESAATGGLIGGAMGAPAGLRRGSLSQDVPRPEPIPAQAPPQAPQTLQRPDAPQELPLRREAPAEAIPERSDAPADSSLEDTDPGRVRVDRRTGFALPTASDLTDSQRAAVEQEMRELGSREAVDRFFGDDSAVAEYAQSVKDRILPVETQTEGGDSLEGQRQTDEGQGRQEGRVLTPETQDAPDSPLSGAAEGGAVVPPATAPPQPSESTIQPAAQPEVAPTPESAATGQETIAEGGIEGAPPAPPVEQSNADGSPAEPEPVLVSNAYTERRRAEIGLPERQKPEVRKDEAVVAEAQRELEQNPDASRRLVDEINADPTKVLRDKDVALLDMRGVALENQLDEAARGLVAAVESGNEDARVEWQRRSEQIESEYQQFASAAELAGTEAARAFRFRAIALKRDLTLAGMMRQKLIANSGKLTPAQRKEIERLNAIIADRDKKIANVEEALRQKSLDAAVQKLTQKARQRAPRAASSGYGTRNRIVSKADAEAARKELREAMGRLSTGIDPSLAAPLSKLALYHLEAGAREFSVWSQNILADVGDAADRIRPYLQDLFNEAKESLKTARLDEIQIRMRDAKDEGKDFAEMGRAVQRLAEQFVAEGVTEREALIDAVHGELVKIDPNMTRREAMDAISGYGQYRQLSKDEIKTTLRDLKGQMQQVSKLQDMQAGKAPAKTGVQRREPSDEERRLIQQVNEAKRKGGFRVVNPEAQLKSALDGVKARLTNSIADLEAQIASGERIVKTKTEVPLDAEAKALRDRRDELKEQFDELFGKREMTDEQRIALAEKAMARSIADYEKRIREGATRRPNVPRLTSERLNELRAERDALAGELRALRDADAALQEEKKVRALERSIAATESKIAQGDVLTRDAKATVDTESVTRLKMERDAAQERLKALRDKSESRQLEQFKKRTAAQIAKLEKRVEQGDYADRVPREITPDAEAKRWMFELDEAKRKFYQGLFDDKLAKKSTAEKVFDKSVQSVNLARAAMTSFDVSAVARQGGILSLSNPQLAAKSIKPMFEALASERGRFAVEQEIRSRPNYRLYKKYNLFLAEQGYDLQSMEEAYASRWADKVPGVAASQRAYVTFLNKLRADAFDSMMATLTKDGEATKAEGEAIANYINVTTGRGSIPFLKETAMVGLNIPFFAPRLVASRFQYLMGQPLWKGSWRTRKLIAKEYAKFLTGVGVVLGLGLAAGADIEDDWRSADFGKMKFGNSRLDPLAGLSQATVLIGRMRTNQTKTQSGEIKDLGGEGPYDQSRGSVAMRFLRSKLSPAFGTVIDSLYGENIVGEPTTPGSVASNLLVPMAGRDIYEAMLEQGVPRGTALGLLALFGMSLQTYEPRGSGSSRPQRPQRAQRPQRPTRPTRD